MKKFGVTYYIGSTYVSTFLLADHEYEAAQKVLAGIPEKSREQFHSLELIDYEKQ